MAIIGIDEVGRGPWAGPLVVGAVILPKKRPDWVDELQDSKKLTEKRRKYYSELILEGAEAVGLGWVWQYEIDEIGLSEALNLATKRAIQEMKKHFPWVQFSEIMIDGNQNFLVGTALEKRVTTLVKGDALIKEISAASIVAKVARDEYMVKLAEKYPEYGFEKHKGYGTKQHLEAIKELGVTPEHRLLIKKIQEVLGIAGVGKKAKATEKAEGDARIETTETTRGEQEAEKTVVKNTTMVGQKAEQKVAEFLESEGQEVLFRNYKNRVSEIDIVSRQGEKLYFTEVRYRKDAVRGSGLESVDGRKKRRMEFAARVFLANRPEFREFQPLLAVADVAGENFEIRDWLILSE